MLQRPLTFRPPLAPEHHGSAIVHLQMVAEDLDTRLARLEAVETTLKRWGERVLWAAVIALLTGANIEKQAAAELIVKVLVAVFGG